MMDSELRGAVINSPTVKECMVISGMTVGEKMFLVACNLIKEEMEKKLVKLVEVSKGPNGKLLGCDYAGPDEEELLAQFPCPGVQAILEHYTAHPCPAISNQ
jgi:hypothetical protein